MTERRLLLYCFHTAPSLIASRIFISQAIARFYGSPRGIFSGQSSAGTGISDFPPVAIIPSVPIFNNLSPTLCNIGT